VIGDQKMDNTESQAAQKNV